MYTKPIYNNLEKSKLQSREQILHNFITILEEFPQYSISQHMCHILRKKGESVETYFWKDDLLLKKFEHYLDELRNDLAQDRNLPKEEY